MKCFKQAAMSTVLSAFLALPLCAAAADTAAAAPQASTKPIPDAQFESQLKLMQQMHEKMLAAKTPAERRKLMSEHIKLMQDSLAMMREMHGPGSAGMMGQDGSGMMGKSGAAGAINWRMDMMESMLQLMLDQQSATPKK